MTREPFPGLTGTRIPEIGLLPVTAPLVGWGGGVPVTRLRPWLDLVVTSFTEDGR